ncbi:PAS domain-containing protein [Acetobacterium paludosum]|uniref:PAS domain-containing protein n=1 Tax=Acetobacterium paludosum TaxID=52693 RepID=A0A923KRY1_9FIRM|nr:sigma 54-interacting transcriptional regulator [Acetobacterium paludosum]MBC3887767.1 PAS domain-containing protein [Acetobacterium paludosum]
MKIHSDADMIKKTWNDFVNDGIIGNYIRKPIVDSWIRCQKAGIDPRALNRTPTVSEANFQKRLEQNKILLDVSIPFMVELQEFVNKSGFSTTLNDPNGVILELICDQSIIEEAFTKNLVRGSIWNEAMAGTNATGLAINLLQPIQVIGAEHYYECYHDLTCSAAPILDENGKLLGILDMSGPKEMAYPHTLGMVVASAKAISRQLCVAESNRKVDLTNHYLSTLIDSMSDGVVAVDVKGKIIGINSHGAKILKTTTFESYGKNILDIMDGETILERNGHQSSQFEEKEKHIVTKSKKINCLVNSKLILRDNGTIVGAVATLKDGEIKSIVPEKSKRKGTRFTFDDIIGESSELLRSIHLSQIAAKGTSTVLLQGESGTGKEMFAQAIHNANQSDKPFIAINCAGIPESLIESVLFGYEEGSFTGASKHGKIGKFELAKDGTIFLDEIGEMPLGTQTVLLRVLQERYIQRIGGSKDIPIDVRIIAATNKNLAEEVKKGKFRQDLYYRLNVLQIDIPPLRKRKKDIPVLVNFFLNEITGTCGKFIEPLHPSTIATMQEYEWPGNVRQFKNAIEQAVNFTETNRIDDYFISNYLPNINEELTEVNRVSPPIDDTNVDLKDLELSTIKKALLLFPERKKAAEYLGISRSTLYRKLKQYHLEDS